MKGFGNGSPQQCIDNLLRISRGEVPYERLKGRDTGVLGLPSTEIDDVVIDAEWMLRTYEPRAEIEGIDIYAIAAQSGAFALQAQIQISEEW